jgi:hypothetical protein
MPLLLLVALLGPPNPFVELAIFSPLVVIDVVETVELVHTPGVRRPGPPTH